MDHGHGVNGWKGLGWRACWCSRLGRAAAATLHFSRPCCTGRIKHAMLRPDTSAWRLQGPQPAHRHASLRVHAVQAARAHQGWSAAQAHPPAGALPRETWTCAAPRGCNRVQAPPICRLHMAGWSISVQPQPGNRGGIVPVSMSNRCQPARPQLPAYSPPCPLSRRAGVRPHPREARPLQHARLCCQAQPGEPCGGGVLQLPQVKGRSVGTALTHKERAASGDDRVGPRALVCHD